MLLFHLRSPLALAVIGACLGIVLGACEPAPAPPPDAELSPATAALDTLDAAAFRAAFEPEALRTVTRATRAAEWSGDAEAAVFEQVVRFAGEDARVLSSDTVGTFSDNLFTAVAPAPVASRRNPAEDVLPEDAAFLAPRNRDAYRRSFLPDTLLLGRPTRVVLVEAVPGEGDGQAVRRARLYIDAATGALAALATERAAETLLFDERGSTFLQARLLPGGAWVPHRIAVDTWVKTFFRPARRFTTTTTFEDAVPAEPVAAR